MDERGRYESRQETLDDEERELMDPESWDWDHPIEVVIAENPSVELGIELAMAEHRLLGKAARAQGLTTHDFIKRSALAAATAQIPSEDDLAETPHARSA